MASNQPPTSEIAVQTLKVQEDVNSTDSPSRDSSDLEAGATDEKQPKNDPNLVNWETEQDSANPLNWSPSLKWRNLGIISIMSLATYILIPFLPKTPRRRLICRK